MANETIANTTVIIESETWDDAYSEPRVETEEYTCTAGETFTESQLEFIERTLQDDDRLTGFRMFEKSVFTPFSNHGDGRVVMLYERGGERRQRVLFEGPTPRQGIKGVGFS